MRTGTMYWLTRRFMAWFFGKILQQQCSGKRKSGYALEWCQLRIGHDGVCTAYNGEKFDSGYEVRSV